MPPHLGRKTEREIERETFIDNQEAEASGKEEGEDDMVVDIETVGGDEEEDQEEEEQRQRKVGVGGGTVVSLVLLPKCK